MPDRKLRVFLCHSSTDKPAVRELYQKLRAEAWIQPWLDEEDIFPGDDWNLEIQKAIRETDAIIVCLSKGSITKEGYVQKEIKTALDYSDEKPAGTVYIIPIRLDECEPPQRLSKWQYADYFEGQRERALERLIVSLKKRAESLNLRFEKPKFNWDKAIEAIDQINIVSRVSNPTETVAPKQSQAESLTYKTVPSKNTEESNEYTSLIESVSISSEELKKQYEQFEAHAIKQGILCKKDNKVPNKLTLSNGIEFMRIPAGEFIMGSKREDEKPQHTVDISYEYWMARFPITNELYNDYVLTNGIVHPASVKKLIIRSKSSNETKTIVDWSNIKNHPVVSISWNHTLTYCQWLNNLLKDELPSGLVLRLPTEAEWEKAARGTDGRLYPWGEEFDQYRCNTKESGLGTTSPVDVYSPQGDSPYGIADMLGNDWEWTQSLFKKYPYNPNDGRENLKTPGRRVMRGCSFSDTAELARITARINLDPNDSIGSFRVVLAPLLPQ
jgi:formylglycine-generating enzyme required for sulfatase activity